MASSVRDTMAAAVAELRGLIGDTALPPEFEDLELQRALDRSRRSVRLGALVGLESYSSGSTSTLTWEYPEGGPWEGGVLLQDGGYATLTPAEEDLSVGRWTFSTSEDGPVFITGELLDVHAAAATLLDEWANRLSRRFDVMADSTTMYRSQAVRNLREQANRERAQGRPVTVAMYRSDEV